MKECLVLSNETAVTSFSLVNGATECVLNSRLVHAGRVVGVGVVQYG
jgi:hypothetical protein